VRRLDYILGVVGYGAPQLDDGTDTFGEYLNGGVLVSDAIYFIAANYIAGDPAKGETLFSAMMDRQVKGDFFPNGGAFQNGIVNAYPQGAEFFTWTGATTGYEGFHGISFQFQQAMVLREAAMRDRLYRPMEQ
jgi:hypothetical protein